MFDEAARQSKGHIFILEILIFAVVLVIVEVVSSLPTLVYGLLAILNDPEIMNAVNAYNAGEITYEQYYEIVGKLETGNTAVLIQLFSTVISTVLVLVFCRFIEKRRLATMGFRKNGIAREYMVGAVVGTAMFSACVGICLATGSLRFDGVSKNINVMVISLFFIGFLLQGMNEEVLVRGYFMVSLSRRNHIALAVFLSSIVFSCLHLMNPGVGILPLINIALFGVFEALYIIKRGSIWGACAIHSLWNFVQGNLYGIRVSGISKLETIMNMTSVEGKDLMNGGEFGLEGGLAVTCVTILAIVIISLTKTNKDEYFDEETAPIIEPAITD